VRERVNTGMLEVRAAIRELEEVMVVLDRILSIPDVEARVEVRSLAKVSKDGILYTIRLLRSVLGEV
jgi:hypothetical protein